MSRFAQRRNETPTLGFELEEFSPGEPPEIVAAIPTVIRTRGYGVGMSSLLAARWLVEGQEALVTLDALEGLLELLFAASRNNDAEAFARYVAELGDAHAFVVKQLRESFARIAADTAKTEAFTKALREKQEKPDSEPVH
ncbi:MAG: hypothetical protein QM817_10430 [Archangium sp.]